MMSRTLLRLFVTLLMFTLLTSVWRGYCSDSKALSSNREDLTTNVSKDAKAPTGWSDDIRLTYCGETTCPAIAVNANFVHVVWRGPINSFPIYYNRSVDGGKTWENGKMLSESGGCIYPRIAISSSNIHIVYQTTSGTDEIQYVKSTDNGETWSIPQIISIVDSYNNRWPDIAVVDDNVHVVWSQEYTQDPPNDQIVYRNSTDGGKTWNPIQMIENSMKTQVGASIAVNGSNVHVVWNAWVPGWENYYKKSTDGCITWSDKVAISKLDGFSSESPRIAVNGSNIHVVWGDYINSTYNEVRYRNSTNNGDSWNDEINITVDDGYQSDQPTISVSGSNVHIAWADEKDSYDYIDADEIYYRNSKDGGITWNTELRLTTALNDSLQPSIASTKDCVHLVWMDDRTGAPANDEIYYKRSPPFGAEPAKITITTSPSILTADGISNSTLTILVYNETGSVMPNQTVSLYINGSGTVSNVTDNGDGSYTATYTAGTVAGNVIITATTGSVSNNTIIILKSGASAKIEINPPGPVTYNKTETCRYAAIGYDIYQNINISWQPIWKVDGDVGTINETGYFTATKKGTGAVNCTDNVTGIYNISIVNVLNSMPVIEPIENQTAYEGQTFILQINATDPDNDALTFSDNSTLFNINSTTGFISFTPNYDNAGIYWINITVTDGEALVWQTFKLEIINVNKVAILEFIENQTAYEEQLFTLQINATDPDNDALIFSENSTLFDINSTTGLILFTPSYNSAGIYWVNITVSDGEALVWQTFKLTIINVNRKPILAAISNQTAYEGQVFLLQVNASDLDNDAITFSDNSTLFDINSTTGLISFTPNYTSAGIYLINITVTDGVDFVWQTFKLDIINVNRAPAAVISSPAQNTKFTTNDNIYFDASSSYNLDNDDLTYVWTSSIDGNIGAAKTFYKKLSAGTHTITLTVSDGTDTDYKQIVITVESPPAPKEQPKGFIPGFEALYLLAIIGVCAILLRKLSQK